MAATGNDGYKLKLRHFSYQQGQVLDKESKWLQGIKETGTTSVDSQVTSETLETTVHNPKSISTSNTLESTIAIDTVEGADLNSKIEKIPAVVAMSDFEVVNTDDKLNLLMAAINKINTNCRGAMIRMSAWSLCRRGLLAYVYNGQGGHGTGKTENREFGSYFFQTGKTQGILL